MGITVVSFLWHGERWKEQDGGQNYVNVLYRAVRRNLKKLDRFVCFSNIQDLELDNGIEINDLPTAQYRGCLPKLWMFSRDAGLYGRVLALDIDIIITGSLDDMATYDGDFAVRSKFAKGLEHLADGDIIGFNPEKCYNIWESFDKNPRAASRETQGRERYFYRKVMPEADRWQEMFPGQIKGYKVDIRKTGKLPDGTRIVSCSGRPRPHELSHQWVKEHWR